MKQTLIELKKLKENDNNFYEKLSDKTKYEDNILGLEEFVRNIYIPQVNKDGIIPQDDTFLSKKELPDIDKYKNSQVKQSVLLDYTRDQVVDMQAIKQADVVMYKGCRLEIRVCYDKVDIYKTGDTSYPLCISINNNIMTMEANQQQLSA